MENGYSTFAKNFQKCCGHSCTRLAYEHQQTDTEYAKSLQECRTLYQEIEQRLGEDEILINQFDAAKNHALFFSDQYVYHQGFQDCVTLLRWVGLLP